MRDAAGWRRLAGNLLGASAFFLLGAAVVWFLNARGAFPGNNVGFMSGILGDMVSLGMLVPGLLLLIAGAACGFRAWRLARGRGPVRVLVQVRR